MQVNDVRVPPDILPEKITVCILQLRSPFFQEANVIRGTEFPIIGWLDSPHEKRKKRFRECLDCISNFDRHINLLVLPEYAVSQDMFEIIKEFVIKNKTVVLGTFYDSSKRVCNTFAVFPENNECSVETGTKFQRSSYETDVLKELNEEEKILLKLNWNVGGLEVSMSIFACLDFLQWSDFPLTIKQTDILITPMCNPKIDIFENSADSIIRWIEPNTKRDRSKVCLFANSVDTIRGGLSTCGGSQIIGPSRISLPQIPAGIEGGLVVDVDCLRMITLPTPITGQDRAVIEAASTFTLDSNWKIQWEPTYQPKPSGYEIHPNARLRVGQKKFYAFGIMKSYWKYKKRLESLPIGCAAIYGLHDLVLYSFEDSYQFLSLRLESCFSPEIQREIKIAEEDYFQVDAILKYRGRLFAEVTESKSGYFTPDTLKSLDRKSVEEALKSVYLISTGQALPVEEKEKLIKKGILLPELSNSDVMSVDAFQGKNEFLVLVFLSCNNQASKINPVLAFEKEVIHTHLEHDERIRTIEICRPVVPVGYGYLQAHYILHIVGYLQDVSDIVLEQIHRTLDKIGVVCGTRVIPVASSLSRDPGVSISESVIEDDITKDRIHEIILTTINEQDPFVIKRLDSDTIELIAKIWYNAEIWMNFREMKGANIGALKNCYYQLGLCLYYISYCLSQENGVYNQEILSGLWSYCGGFYRELAGEIESLLGNLFRGKSEQMGEDFIAILHKAWQKHSRKKEDLPFSKIDLIPLGTLVQSIIYWNEYVEAINLIGTAGLGSKLKILQSCGISEFRDCLAHPPDGITTMINKHLGSPKGVKRLLQSLAKGLDLLLQEKYSS
ncbi:hypothetical protein ACFLZ8_04850 [Planctomycetota bacterium]